MTNNKCNIILSVLFCMLFCFCLCIKSYAEEDELTPEQLVAKHFKSLGAPNALSAIHTRTAAGIINFTIIRGPSGETSGKVQWASEHGKAGLVMQFNDVEYPKEHFAFNDKNISVAEPTPHHMSRLGNFFISYGKKIFMAGLIGGVLSVDWPLLDIQDSEAVLKYSRKKIDDREFHELDYQIPRSFVDTGLNSKLYFDLDTYRHVMSEYKFAGGYRGVTFEYVLLEKFDNFKEVDGITLPFSYTLRFSGNDHTYIYSLDLSQINHNLKVDPKFYIVERK